MSNTNKLSPATAAQIRQLGRRAVNDTTRAVADAGVLLTYGEDDELGIITLDWMRDRLGLAITETAGGVECAPDARPCEDDSLAASPPARCACGTWSGVRCEAVSTDDEMVTVRYVRPMDRGDVTTLRRNPISCANYWRTLRVTPSCAEAMIESEPEWVEVQS